MLGILALGSSVAGGRVPRARKLIPCLAKNLQLFPIHKARTPQLSHERRWSSFARHASGWDFLTRSWYSPSEDLRHSLKYKYIFWLPKGYVFCKPQTLNRVDPTEGARCSLTRLRRRFALRQPRRRSCARQFPSNVFFCLPFFYIYTLSLFRSFF